MTQLAFHPLNADIIFVASRRSTAIQVFDIQNTTAPIGRLERPASTNQRLSFDVDPWGRWIASGDEVSSEQDDGADDSSAPYESGMLRRLR